MNSLLAWSHQSPKLIFYISVGSSYPRLPSHRRCHGWRTEQRQGLKTWHIVCLAYSISACHFSTEKARGHSSASRKRSLKDRIITLFSAGNGLMMSLVTGGVFSPH